MSELNTPIDYLKGVLKYLNDFELEYNSVPNCKVDLDYIGLEDNLDQDVLDKIVLKPLKFKTVLIENDKLDQDLRVAAVIIPILWEVDNFVIPFKDRYLSISEEDRIECSTQYGDADLIVKLTILDSEFNAISTPTLIRYSIWSEDSWGYGYRLTSDNDLLDFKVVTKEQVTKTITVTEYHNV